MSSSQNVILSKYLEYSFQRVNASARLNATSTALLPMHCQKQGREFFCGGVHDETNADDPNAIPSMQDDTNPDPSMFFGTWCSTVTAHDSLLSLKR